jgi:hypothetical protein
MGVAPPHRRWHPPEAAAAELISWESKTRSATKNRRCIFMGYGSAAAPVFVMIPNEEDKGGGEETVHIRSPGARRGATELMKSVFSVSRDCCMNGLD